MIRVQNVSKTYGRHIHVVKNVSFSVEKGNIYGLLGPNGAGKTTLMQMIATLLSPTSGAILVDGYNTTVNPREIRRRIGFLTSDVKLDPSSTPNQLYRFFGDLYQIDRDELDDRKQISFDRLRIFPFADKRINELSTGMRQKISIAISLIHHPPIIIFDEPTNGLDILTAHEVSDYLLELKRAGHTILLSTHIFSVAQALCDSLAILVDGRIVARGKVSELMSMTQSDTFESAFLKLYKKHHTEG